MGRIVSLANIVNRDRLWSRNPGWASKMLFRKRQAEAELLYVHKEDVVDVIDRSGNNTNPNISFAGSRKMGWHPAY